MSLKQTVPPFYQRYHETDMTIALSATLTLTKKTDHERTPHPTRCDNSVTYASPSAYLSIDDYTLWQSDDSFCPNVIQLRADDNRDGFARAGFSQHRVICGAFYYR